MQQCQVPFPIVLHKISRKVRKFYFFGDDSYHIQNIFGSENKISHWHIKPPNAKERNWNVHWNYEFIKSSRSRKKYL